MPLYYKFLSSPVGRLKLVASGHGLVAILWENEPPRRVPLSDLICDENDQVLRAAEAQLAEYFAGCRNTFSLPLDLRGTPFQNAVWQALRAIPWGETRTYVELANQLNRPRAARAVGAANGRNPVAIVVPCHRVIGSNGKLTGFAGGLDVKAHLLRLEGASQP